MSLGHYLAKFRDQHGVQKTVQFFQQAVKEGKVTRDQISLRNLAEGLLGYDWTTGVMRVRESWAAIDPSAFSNITGQLLINEVKDRYKAADFIGEQLVDTVKITNGNLGTQKTPWLSAIVDAPDVLHPQQQYPFSVFQEQWITYPAPIKRGMICAVTMEMIFSDLTGQAMEAARAVAERLAIQKEENILNVVLGLTNNHIWNDTSYSTYVSTPWDNTITSNTLVNWESLNVVEQQLAGMTDPVSGKAIMIKPSALLVMPYRKYNAKRVLNATETRSGDITTGTGDQILSVNPLDTKYPVLASQYAYNLLVASGVSAANAREYFYLGDFKKAFVYREVHPLDTVQAPPYYIRQFEQDIAVAVRCSEYGVAGVRDPRFVCQSINS